MEIKVFIKNVYGKDLVYPSCEKAKLFAQLIHRKTLTSAEIATIKELGYTVRVVTPDTL